MNKKFYKINLDCSKSYKTLYDLIERSRSEDIHWYQETGFSYFLKLGELYYSCDSNCCLKFERMLCDFNVKFEKKPDFGGRYQEYISTFPQNSNQAHDCSLENQVVVIEKRIQKIIEGSNGCQILTEESVANKDSIKIYVESNEVCSHHIPHVHVSYNHDFNVLSISLVGFNVLAGDGRGAKAKKAIDLLKDNIDKAREIWNKCNNHSKFDVNENGKLLSTFHFEKID